MANSAKESLREADVQTQTTQRNTTVLDSLPLLPKKARIGSEILRDAMKYFCDANGNDGTRRWVRHIHLITSAAEMGISRWACLYWSY